MKQETIRAGIWTLGCKVNQYESQAIAEELTSHGFLVVPTRETCDLYIINTCTVTAESDRKARQFIRRATSRNPEAKVIVTGCLAQTDADSLAAMGCVHAVVGNGKKMDVVSEAIRLFEEPTTQELRISVPSLDNAPFEPMKITFFDRTRAYVKIEDGCENRCTYCIIPNARGAVRSKPPEDVIGEVTALTENGCREVVLTGIETASYGKDLADTDLATLLEQIDRIPNIGRVRLGSLDPSLIRPAFVERIAKLSSLAPHFHLSLQSGSSRILAKMKRKYNRDMAMDAIRLLRASIPSVEFTTDVIVGFPGETEEDFEDTVRFVEEARFLNVHIFPYSKRKGTPAALMGDQIPTDVKRQRLHRLEEITARIRAERLRDAIARDPRQTVLFETYENGFLQGHTASFLEVTVRANCPMHGETATVILTDTDGVRCFGIFEEEFHGS